MSHEAPSAATSPPERVIPIGVVRNTLRDLGIELDERALLLGIVLGKLTPDKFLDPEHLRFLATHVYGGSDAD